MAACGSTLNCLVLSGLNQLTDASLVMLAARALNLQKIYADGCTRLSLRAFIRLKVWALVMLSLQYSFSLQIFKCLYSIVLQSTFRHRL